VTDTGIDMYLYSSFNFGARRGWVINATHWRQYPWERDQVPILKESEWATGTFGGAEKI